MAHTGELDSLQLHSNFLVYLWFMAGKNAVSLGFVSNLIEVISISLLSCASFVYLQYIVAAQGFSTAWSNGSPLPPALSVVMVHCLSIQWPLLMGGHVPREQNHQEAIVKCATSS